MNHVSNYNPSTKEFIDQIEINEKMKKIKKKIIVLSGKGGVGKSSVAVNLAVGLSLEGFQVGLLDVDIHGPSVPKMLNLEKAFPEVINNKISPVKYSENLKVMSISFLLENPDDAIIWRGPLKMGIIRQFLNDVNWGELDYLIVDSPPGTGDEPLSICQLIENPEGAIIVTTPQELAIIDVKKSIKFCEQLNCKIIGVIENMSGFTCPYCNNTTNIFKSGGGMKMAEELSVPFLGQIPIDINMVNSADSGQPIVFHNYSSSYSTNVLKIIEKIVLDNSN